MSGWFGLAMVLAAASAHAESSPAPADRGEELRRRLVELVQATRSASWTQLDWERKGDREQRVLSRCLWSDGKLRLEVAEGKGAGASLLREGDQVTIRPPGVLRALRLHRSVDDEQLLSLRGKGLRRAGFLPDLQHALAHWAEVELAFSGDVAVLSYLNADRLAAQMAIRVESLAPLFIEAHEAGELIERRTFEEVRFGVVVDPQKLLP